MGLFRRRQLPAAIFGRIVGLEPPITYRTPDTSGRSGYLSGALGVPLRAGSRKQEELGWAQVEVHEGGGPSGEMIYVRYSYPLPRGPQGKLEAGDLVEVTSIETNIGTEYQYLIVQRLHAAPG